MSSLDQTWSWVFKFVTTGNSGINYNSLSKAFQAFIQCLHRQTFDLFKNIDFFQDSPFFQQMRKYCSLGKEATSKYISFQSNMILCTCCINQEGIAREFYGSLNTHKIHIIFMYILVFDPEMRDVWAEKHCISEQYLTVMNKFCNKEDIGKQHILYCVKHQGCLLLCQNWYFILMKQTPEKKKCISWRTFSYEVCIYESVTVTSNSLMLTMDKFINFSISQTSIINVQK